MAENYVGLAHNAEVEGSSPSLTTSKINGTEMRCGIVIPL